MDNNIAGTKESLEYCRVDKCIEPANVYIRGIDRGTRQTTRTSG